VGPGHDDPGDQRNHQHPGDHPPETSSPQPGHSPS
jgi:hypothetical protein